MIKIKKYFQSTKWFSSKRRWFLIKHLVVVIVLVIIFYFLLRHHMITDDNIFSLVAVLSLNFSFILIPTFLYLIEVRKNFKEEFDDIFSLKNKLVYLRKFIANEISGTPNEKHRDIIIDPSSINQIIELLRKFKFHSHSTLLLSHIEQRRLYNLDLIIIDVIKRIKKYDSGKDFKTILENWDFKNSKETIERLERTNEITELKNLFLNDLSYPIAYSLLYKINSKAFAHYYYILDTYPNEAYQKVLDAIMDILRYNIESRGEETQVFNTNIVKAIRILTQNQENLFEIGVLFDSNIHDGEFTLTIFNEPCDLLIVKIKIDKTFKVNTRYDEDLEENLDWVKENMVSHIQGNFQQFGLEIKDGEFWNSP